MDGALRWRQIRLAELSGRSILWPAFIVVEEERLSEAGAGLDRRPQIGVVAADGPGAGAAHGKSVEDDPVDVDWVLLLDGLDGVQDVDRPRALVADALPAEGVEHDAAVQRRHLPSRAHPLPDEVEVRALRAPPVQPNVERDFASVRREGGRQLEAVRLRRAVDDADVAARDAAVLVRRRDRGRRLGPARGSARLQLAEPRFGRLHQLVGAGCGARHLGQHRLELRLALRRQALAARPLDPVVDPALHHGALIVELAVLDGEADGLGEDGDVGVQVVLRKGLEPRLHIPHPRLERAQHARLQLDAARWDGERDRVVDGAERRGGRGLRGDGVQEVLQAAHRLG